jgi:hypothetical protein
MLNKKTDNKKNLGKNQKIIVIILIALLIAIFAVIFYKFSNKFFSKNSRENKNITIDQINSDSPEVYNYDFSEEADQSRGDFNDLEIPDVIFENDAVKLDYRNSKYGFNLKLPPSWQDYEVETKGSSETQSLCFYFLAENDNLEEEIREDQSKTEETEIEEEEKTEINSQTCILEIIIEEVSDWNSKESNLAGGLKLIDKNEEYVFYLKKTKSCEGLSRFECERAGEVDSVMESFKLDD